MNYDLLIVDDSKAALFLFKKIIGLSGAPINNLLTADNGKNAISEWIQVFKTSRSEYKAAVDSSFKRFEEYLENK